VIGQDAAVRLSAHFGGRQLYVPHTPPAGSELVGVVGEIAARKLGRRFGGVIYMVPIREGKRARIIEARRQKRKIREIASDLACTERHVYKVLAEFRQDGGALPDLPFDDSDLPSEER
jgi:Mor family transcriptional regulator